MNDNLCCLCRTNPPAFICFCSEAMLCVKCISPHLLASPETEHKPLPLTGNELVQAMSLHGFSPRETIDEETVRTMQRQILAKELRRLQSFLTDALGQVQSARENWVAQIQRLTDELAAALTEEVRRLYTEIDQCLTDLDNFQSKPWLGTPLFKQLQKLKSDEELLTLDIEVRPMNLIGHLKQAVSYVTSYEQAKHIPNVLYKFFGGSMLVGIFDLETETYVQQIKANVMFLHNSCWTVGNNGEVYITGGSKTGKSRSDVLIFNPSFGTLSELEPMLIARRSHTSIYYNDCCFVFGGILEDEPLSLCECYLTRERRWMTLPSMTERRAYLGCCQYRSSLVVCGGGQSSSMEIYNTENSSFRYLQLPVSDLWDNVSLITMNDSIFILHGNFQGEISRFYPVTGQVMKEKQLCYGNSWSNCKPVMYRETIYMLRSDSVFKYEINTGASAYLLRMTKAIRNANEM